MLTLERRPKGGTSWTALATVTTGSGGTLDRTQPVTPQASTDYRLRHAADLLPDQRWVQLISLTRPGLEVEPMW